MKKHLLFLTLIGLLGLTGCGGEEQSGDNEEGGSNLEYNEAQSKSKVHEIIESGGLEVSYKYSSDGSELENFKIGTKGDFFWVETDESKSMIEIVDETNIRYYNYEEEQHAYTAGTSVAYGDTAVFKENQIEGHTTYFYLAHHVDGTNSFYKVKDTTFVGRSASEYKYQIAAAGAEVHQRVIVDKETGITLLWEGSGSTVYGEYGAARFEVTEFKTGDQVSVPSIVA